MPTTPQQGADGSWIPDSSAPSALCAKTLRGNLGQQQPPAPHPTLERPHSAWDPCFTTQCLECCSRRRHHQTADIHRNCKTRQHSSALLQQMATYLLQRQVPKPQHSKADRLPGWGLGAHIPGDATPLQSISRRYKMHQPTKSPRLTIRRASHKTLATAHS